MHHLTPRAPPICRKDHPCIERSASHFHLFPLTMGDRRWARAGRAVPPKRPGSEGPVESVANPDTRVAPIRAKRVAQAILVIAALLAPGMRPGVPTRITAGDRHVASLDRDRARALPEEDALAAIELDDTFCGVLLAAAANDKLCLRAHDVPVAKAPGPVSLGGGRCGQHRHADR
jgi:hypothetical protein